MMNSNTTFPRIVAKDPYGDPCLVAEGKAGDQCFRIGVTFDASAALPERHETIKKALLDRAREITRQIEETGRFEWAAEGFEPRRPGTGECGRSPVWERVYSLRDIWSVLQ